MIKTRTYEIDAILAKREKEIVVIKWTLQIITLYNEA